ncbi:hypothetical protein CGCF415_v005270 [Colletotrichum fructicola]|uniref:Secreted protein n=1 Tax=Colletotrichum fructicola (strain Nara gc5) TaxID=1213859 RepID=A0A7J6J4W5_COLFN|nr:hypothetical protein CFRS1_v009286 [Colletotrichum fructicola]KAF4483330.1 hypothetical protein CGGC5_v010125 [Colletotrichum fructicola Nara gc5]KAF4901885.1 hypothetical protein CGCFRS4_v002587 [Colletotrichum fructicola]KAF4910336.1 hypothetical protein CGCF415_v005270 [Colletotrichum fructicola]KAF4939847.1 hypothetical protein CGCF245_v003195 [Colletotrichum fructicola]
MDTATTSLLVVIQVLTASVFLHQTHHDLGGNQSLPNVRLFVIRLLSVAALVPSSRSKLVQVNRAFGLGTVQVHSSV